VVGYWSDERDTLIQEIKMINQSVIKKSQENAELKEENEKLKMQIENLKRDLAAYEIPSGRWNWYGD